jgi:hypothetical protein
MYVVELLLVGVSTCGSPNYVRLIEAVSYSSTYVSLVYGADSLNWNIPGSKSPDWFGLAAFLKTKCGFSEKT